MLPQQLLTDRIPVFGNDPDQAVNILGVVSNQFGEFLHLRFKMLETPAETFLLVGTRFFLGSRTSFFRQGRHQHILFHNYPFAHR